MPLLGTASLGGIVLLEHLHNLAYDPIPYTPLHGKCAGEKTNATAFNPIGNPVDGDGRLLLHLPLPGNVVRHKNLLAPKFDEDVILQYIATTRMLLTAAPTVGASSPNNIKDDAAGMPARRRRTCTFCSHIQAVVVATAWRFVQGAAHMMQYLSPLLGAEHAPYSHSKVGEEEAILGGCGVVVVCGCLFYVVQNCTSTQKLE
jgi:hypothetical protein